jgi:phthiodiolone/phenolphthiodiolone dimycocerosates ketoreductase
MVMPQPPVGVVRTQLRFARLARLDSLAVWDHFQNFTPTALWDRQYTWLAADEGSSPHEFFDYQTLLGHLAARAGRIRLGVTVTEPIRRHPVLIAQAMATLAHLTVRAPILGLGSGELVNTGPYGLAESRPVERLEEAVQIVRLCFASQRPLTFQGKHFQLHGARMDLLPPPGRTPQIWIGGHGPRMLALAGRYGDGWHPVAVTSPQEYSDKLAVVRAAAVGAGRDPGSFTASLEAHVVAAPTAEEAQTIAHSRAVRFTALVLPATVWRQHGREHPLGIEHGWADLLFEDYDRATLDAALDAVPEELLPLQFCGTPDQIADQLRPFADAGMNHVSLMFLSALYSRRAAVFSTRAALHIAHALR